MIHEPIEASHRLDRKEFARRLEERFVEQPLEWIGWLRTRFAVAPED